ncbi:hypothetical protein, partial [Bradyrhizobium sp.]|uniref:hypothetical protein n=1 Tax=Bradyrhizobium sp. TaxID=376 RepID=UPI003C36C46C
PPCHRERASLASDPTRGEGTETPPLRDEEPPRIEEPRFFIVLPGKFGRLAPGSPVREQRPRRP